MEILFDGGIERYLVENVSSTDAYGQVLSGFAYLGMEYGANGNGVYQEKQSLHCTSVIFWSGE